jgi:hypothetical protein
MEYGLGLAIYLQAKTQYIMITWLLHPISITLTLLPEQVDYLKISRYDIYRETKIHLAVPHRLHSTIYGYCVYVYPISLPYIPSFC